MREFEFIINNENGVHARPAGRLVQEAKKFEDSEIILKKADKTASAISLLQVMQLGLKQGDTVLFAIKGGNEIMVENGIREVVQNYF